MTLDELIEQKRKEKVREELNTIVQKKLQVKQEEQKKQREQKNAERVQNVMQKTADATSKFKSNVPVAQKYYEKRAQEEKARQQQVAKSNENKVNLPVNTSQNVQVSNNKLRSVNKANLPTFTGVAPNNVKTKKTNNNLLETIPKIFGNIGYGAGNGLIAMQQAFNRNIQKQQDRDKELFDNINKKVGAPTVDEMNKKTFGDQKKEPLIDLEKQKQINNQKIQENIGTSSKGVGKKLSELAPTVGQMLPGMASGGVGTLYFAGSAKGNYYDEAIQRGMSEEQADRYSGVMALLEAGGETLGANLTKAVGKNISKGGLKQGAKMLALDVTENVAEEAVMEPLSELTATAVAGKEYANWDNIGKRMLQAGIDGGLVGMIMGGASAGIGSAVNVANKISKGQTVTQNEINAVKQDVNNRMTDKQVQQKLQEAQDIINKVQNEPVNTQTQQITGQENKMAQNGNMEQINGVENNEQTLYNNNESESGINGKQQTIKSNDQRGTTGLFTRHEERTTNGTGYQENNAEQITRTKQEEIGYIRKPENQTSKLNNNQSKIKEAFEGKGAKVVFYSLDSNKGGYYDKGTLYINQKNATDIQQLNEATHEYAHYLIRDNAEFNQKVSSIAEQIVKNEETGSSEAIRNYIMDRDTNISVEDIDRIYQTVVEEILSDYAIDISNNIDFNIDNQYGIDVNILDEYKTLLKEYLPDIKLEDSNESSFSMSKNRTEQEIANDNSISDLQAIKEASQQVNTPSLEVAEKKENELKNKGIEKSPTIDYIKRKRSKEKVNFTEIKDTLAQKFVNKGHYIDKLAKQTQNKNLTYLYDRTLNTFNEAQISIGDYQINSKGDVVGSSIINIFKPSIDAGLELEFEDYLLNKHNISRYAYEKGIFGSEISSIDSADTVLKYEKQYPEFKEWAKAVNNYNDNNLKDLVVNGMISQDTYDKLKSMYGDYVPTYRDIVENMSQYEDNAVGNEIIKKATQSDKDILSVKESMAEQTLMQKKAIRMNNLGLELYKTLGKDNTILKGIEVDPLAIQTVMGNVIEKATDGTNIFTIFKDGEMIQFKISDELYTAFSKDTLQNKINNSKVAKTLLTPVEKLSKAQRELLTTYSIGFSLTNPIKDFGYAIFSTKYGSLRFAKNYAKALYNIGTKGSWYESYKNNGGTANTYFDYEKGILPTKNKSFASKIKKANNIMEQAPRLAEYISTIEKGGNIDEALYNASEITVNFKRGGDITKAVNKYGANFLNASVQGLDKIYRDITNQNGWKGYARLITRATVFQIAPTIINSLLLGDDEDYEDLPEYIKDNYYLFKMGNGKFFRIPKDRLTAVVGGIARRTLETVQGKEADWGSIVSTTVSQLAPNNPTTDNIFAPIKQAAENKAWYGGDIVSTRLQKLPVAEQYDESTDEFSKWLGEKLNISPKKINYILDQYSGGVGDVLLPILTPQAENNILEDKFTTDAVMKNKNVSKYYEQLEELEKKKNSINTTDEDILKYKYFSDSLSDISDLYNEKRKIQNLDMPDSEKKEKVREIQKQINEKVEEKLDTVNNMKIDNNIATVGENQYYKATNLKDETQEWKKLSEDEMKKNKNISLKTYADYKEKVAKETIKQRKSGTIKQDASLKDKDKIQILLSSNYMNEERTAIYENYIKNANDTEYTVMKTTGINIVQYLRYKQQEFTSDKKDDGTLTGKTVSKSKQKKITEYLNSMNITGNQRLLLYSMQGYSTTSAQKKQLANYVNGLNLNKQDKLKLFNKFSGFTVYKNGRVTW